MKKRKELLMNPVRMEILRYLMQAGSATPGALCEALPDIPRTTLYRHVNILNEAGYLKVVKEVRVRGTYEREYAIDEEVMRGSTPKEQERRKTASLLLKMMGDFETYYEKPDSDSGRDMIFFTENTLQLSDEEYSAFLQELFALLAKYDGLEGEGKKPRSITMISAPITEKKERTGDKKEVQKEAKKEAKREVKKEVKRETPKESRSEYGNAAAPHMTFSEAMAKLQEEERQAKLREEERQARLQEEWQAAPESGTAASFSCPGRRFTDRGAHGIALEMPADATYDMAEKARRPARRKPAFPGSETGPGDR